MPLAAVPSDPMVLERLGVFTEKYGYEFAELSAETQRSSMRAKGRPT